MLLLRAEYDIGSRISRISGNDASKTNSPLKACSWQCILTVWPTVRDGLSVWGVHKILVKGARSQAKMEAAYARMAELATRVAKLEA